MNTLFRTLQRIALALVLSLSFWSLAPATYAQDVECDCIDYEQTYTQARTAFEAELELYAEIVSSGDAGLFVEYISGGELQASYEFFLEAQTNWQGCQQRIRENTDACNEEVLEDAERDTLMNNPGRAAFFAETVEGLIQELLEDLAVEDHGREALMETSQVMTFEENVKIVIGYLVAEHNLAEVEATGQMRFILRSVAELFLLEQGFFPDAEYIQAALERASGKYDLRLTPAYFFLVENWELTGGVIERNVEFLRAVHQFLQGLGIQVPAVICPNCQAVRTELQAKQAEKANAEQDLRDATQEETDAQEAIDEYKEGIKNAILNADGCENRSVAFDALSAGQASGKIQGVDFFCSNEAAIEAMLEELEAFRRTQTKSLRDLEQDKTNAKNKKEAAQTAVDKLDREIKKLEARRDACVRLQQAIQACVNAVLGDEEDKPQREETSTETNTSSTSNGGSTAPARPTRNTDANIESSFQYRAETSDNLTRIRNQNRTRLRLIHAAINKDFAESQQRVDTGRFSDFAPLRERSKRAVEFLTNRVPLFQGENNGARFGAQEDLRRAVVAEILLRLAKIGAIEDYTLDVSGVENPEDVPEGVWYEEGVLAAIANGVFQPTNDRVRPGDFVNWAELVTILVRFLKINEIAVDAPSFENVVSEVWYTANFEALIDAEIVTREEFGESKRPWDVPTKMDLGNLLYNTLGEEANFLATATGGLDMAIENVDTSNLNNRKLAEISRTDVDNGTVNSAGEIIVNFDLKPTNTADPEYDNLIELDTNAGLMGSNRGVEVRIRNSGRFSSERRTSGSSLELELVITNSDLLFSDNGKGGEIEFTVTDKDGNEKRIRMEVGVR